MVKNNKYSFSSICFMGFVTTLLPDSATDTMDLIIWFHHTCMFVIIVVLSLVAWFCFDLMVEFGLVAYFKPGSNNVNTLLARREALVLRQVNHGTLLEIVWTILPILILILIATPSFTLLYFLDEVVAPSLTVKIIGHQWYWTYEYSDYSSDLSFDSYPVAEDDLVLGQSRLLEVDNILWLPSHVHVRLLVTSDDVLHSWALPSFGIKMDCVPGRLNQVSLLAKREGLFSGQCSELCGTGHGFMPIQVKVVSLDLFNLWLNSKIGSDSESSNTSGKVNIAELWDGVVPHFSEGDRSDNAPSNNLDENDAMATATTTRDSNDSHSDTDLSGTSSSGSVEKLDEEVSRLVRTVYRQLFLDTYQERRAALTDQFINNLFILTVKYAGERDDFDMFQEMDPSHSPETREVIKGIMYDFYYIARENLYQDYVKTLKWLDDEYALLTKEEPGSSRQLVSLQAWTSLTAFMDQQEAQKEAAEAIKSSDSNVVSPDHKEDKSSNS